MNASNGTGTLGLGLIDREELAKRWRVSIETLKRLEKKKKLRRVALGERLVRYRVADIIAIEDGEAA